MLNQEMLNKLRHMKMTGMAEALEYQEQDPSYNELTFHERLNLMVDWEYSKRQHSRLQRLINQAKFQDSKACVEDINYAIERKLDRSFILELALAILLLMLKTSSSLGQLAPANLIWPRH